MCVCVCVCMCVRGSEERDWVVFNLFSIWNLIPKSSNYRECFLFILLLENNNKQNITRVLVTVKMQKCSLILFVSLFIVMFSSVQSLSSNVQSDIVFSVYCNTSTKKNICNSFYCTTLCLWGYFLKETKKNP